MLGGFHKALFWALSQGKMWVRCNKFMVCSHLQQNNWCIDLPGGPGIGSFHRWKKSSISRKNQCALATQIPISCTPSISVELTQAVLHDVLSTVAEPAKLYYWFNWDSAHLCPRGHSATSPSKSACPAAWRAAGLYSQGHLTQRHQITCCVWKGIH